MGALQTNHPKQRIFALQRPSVARKMECVGPLVSVYAAHSLMMHRLQERAAGAIAGLISLLWWWYNLGSSAMTSLVSEFVLWTFFWGLEACWSWSYCKSPRLASHCWLGTAYCSLCRPTNFRLGPACFLLAAFAAQGCKGLMVTSRLFELGMMVIPMGSGSWARVNNHGVVGHCTWWTHDYEWLTITASSIYLN